jgi:hypothetical protein
MTPIFITFTNHSDHEVLDLFFNNVDWIRQNFSVVLVESMPCTYSSQKLVDHFALAISGASFDFFPVASQLLDILPHELQFLNTPISDQSKITLVANRKLASWEKLRQKPCFEGDSTFSALSVYFKKYKLFQALYQAGVHLEGAEFPAYFEETVQKKTPEKALAYHEKREQFMLDQILKYSLQGERVFFDVGAGHAIRLVGQLMARGQTTGSLVRLIIDESCNKKEGQIFWEWHTQFEAQKPLLPYGHTLSVLTIPSALGIAEQNRQFQGSFRYSLGCTLPPNMYMNSQGNSEVGPPPPFTTPPLEPTEVAAAGPAASDAAAGGPALGYYLVGNIAPLKVKR